MVSARNKNNYYSVIIKYPLLSRALVKFGTLSIITISVIKMPPKDVAEMANSDDLDQTVPGAA